MGLESQDTGIRPEMAGRGAMPLFCQYWDHEGSSVNEGSNMNHFLTDSLWTKSGEQTLGLREATIVL